MYSAGEGKKERENYVSIIYGMVRKGTYQIVKMNGHVYKFELPLNKNILSSKSFNYCFSSLSLGEGDKISNC